MELLLSTVEVQLDASALVPLCYQIGLAFFEARFDGHLSKTIKHVWQIVSRDCLGENRFDGQADAYATSLSQLPAFIATFQYLLAD